MRVDDMLINIHRQCGEATDIAPYSFNVYGQATFDITTPGAIRLLDLLNRAYIRLCNWRFQDGSLLRFDELTKHGYYKYNNIESSIIANSTNVVRLDDCLFNEYTQTKSLRPLYMTIAGTTYLVVSYVAASMTFTLDGTPSTLVDDLVGTLATLSTRTVWISDTDSTADSVSGFTFVTAPNSRVSSIQVIQNLTNGGQDIIPSDRMERFFETYQGTSTPTLFKTTERSIEFNYVPIDSTMFMLKYYAEPETLSVSEQEPVIPRPWHELIWQLAANMRLLEVKATEAASVLFNAIRFNAEQLARPHERKFELQEARVFTYY